MQKNGKERKFIGLFSNDFPKESSNENFWNELNKYREWERELAKKRDPVAHRVPLYVVPSIITNDEHQEYQKLSDEENAAFIQLDFSKVAHIYQKQRKLGTFPMVFAHDPDEQLIPIYPTLPSDMANLIKIQKIVLKHLQ